MHKYHAQLFSLLFILVLWKQYKHWAAIFFTLKRTLRTTKHVIALSYFALHGRIIVGFNGPPSCGINHCHRETFTMCFYYSIKLSVPHTCQNFPVNVSSEITHGVSFTIEMTYTNIHWNWGKHSGMDLCCNPFPTHFQGLYL